MCFSCDTYLQDSRVMQKQVCTSFRFITGASIHEQWVGNVSGFLAIFSKRNNLKVSVKKISCITLLLTQWQGRIDRTFVLLSGKTSLTSRKSSAWFDTNTRSSVGEPHRIRRDHYWMHSCWLCLYTCRSKQYIWRAWIWFGYLEMDTGRCFDFL